MNTSLVNTVYDTASSCSVLLCTKQQINRLKTRKITWFSVIGLSSLPYLTFSMISRVDRKHFRSLTTMTVLVFPLSYYDACPRISCMQRRCIDICNTHSFSWLHLVSIVVYCVYRGCCHRLTKSWHRSIQSKFKAQVMVVGAYLFGWSTYAAVCISCVCVTRF